MKRLSVLIFFTLVVLGIKAQAETTDKVKTYIEIYSWHKSSTPTIDTGFGKGNESYRTEDGQVIEFHSAMGAVNWFVSNGWKLESQHMSTCNDRTVKMYVVSKEIPLDLAKSRQNGFIKK